MLLKIKTERKKKHALELIAKLMESFGLVRIDREAEDFRLPYEDNDALIERGLIKVILPKGESLDENTIAVKADLSGIEAKKPEPTGEVTEEAEEIISEEITEEPVFTAEKMTKKALRYSYLGEDDDEALFSLPYTREEYLALRGAKKKAVLKRAVLLLRYEENARALEELRSTLPKTKKTAKRLTKLEAKLAKTRKLLPTDSLWADAVKRVVR